MARHIQKRDVKAARKLAKVMERGARTAEEAVILVDVCKIFSRQIYSLLEGVGESYAPPAKKRRK